jgi:hypothetical protein
VSLTGTGTSAGAPVEPLVKCWYAVTMKPFVLYSVVRGIWSVWSTGVLRWRPLAHSDLVVLISG